MRNLPATLICLPASISSRELTSIEAGSATLSSVTTFSEPPEAVAEACNSARLLLKNLSPVEPFWTYTVTGEYLKGL